MICVNVKNQNKFLTLKLYKCMRHNIIDVTPHCDLCNWNNKYPAGYIEYTIKNCHIITVYRPGWWRDKEYKLMHEHDWIINCCAYFKNNEVLDFTPESREILDKIYTSFCYLKSKGWYKKDI